MQGDAVVEKQCIYCGRWFSSKAKFLDLCPYRDSSLGNRDPYVGILIPTRDPLPQGTLGKLVLHRNRQGELVWWLAPAKTVFSGGKTFSTAKKKTVTQELVHFPHNVGIPYPQGTLGIPTLNPQSLSIFPQGGRVGQGQTPKNFYFSSCRMYELI